MNGTLIVNAFTVLSLSLTYAQKLTLKVCYWKIIILLCVFVITVVASDHVGEIVALFFFFNMFSFVSCQFFCNIVNTFVVCVLITSAFVRPAILSLLANKEILQ